MKLVELLLLAVVQGLTEFLPVSSSGHLVLFHIWTGAFAGDILFDVVLHVGTLAAVLVFYRREVFRLMKFDTPALQYLFALVVGTLPAVVVGLLFKDTLEALFTNTSATAVALIVTGLILLSTRMARQKERTLYGDWQPAAPSLSRALLIGTAQAMAITPGISRSGSTIAASLWLGLDRAEAARFSFLLSVPAILGALVLNLKDGLAGTEAPLTSLLLGAGVAFLVGLGALRLTALLVVQRHFWKFSFYCLALGGLVLILS